jgi:hypothetical protein
MLEGKHFQNAYVCDNIEAGIDLFRGRGLQKEPMIIPVEQLVDTPAGKLHQQVKICFIWIDDLQYELIEVIRDDVGVYDKCLSNGGPLRFHHICTRIDDWTDFRARVYDQDLPVVMERDLGGDSLKFLYLDGRAVFGHYLEYVWMSDAQWAQTRAM